MQDSNKGHETREVRMNTQIQNQATAKKAIHIVPAVVSREGGGFLVHRPFPTGNLKDFDPFLLLDEMGPVTYRPGEAVGAPDHPHRGFETVTYMLEGAMEHRDSAGHAGKLRPGDVQWMTAGGGVVHSEMPEEEFLRKGGKAHGFQLWVNLPRKDKMSRPRYQEIPREGIPVAKSADGLAEVRVIAGESLGKKAVIDTRIPITYLHVTLKPGGKLEQVIPAGNNAFAYVIRGDGAFGRRKTRATEHQMVVFEQGGEVVTAVSDPQGPGAEFLLIAGTPLNEPVVRYGPFVMNTEEEIHEAIDDYRNGRMGIIRAL